MISLFTCVFLRREVNIIWAFDGMIISVLPFRDKLIIVRSETNPGFGAKASVTSSWLQD